ncbi:MAG: hypothetical protein Q4D45_14165 [Lachnospiraceae bacterium]|nr:hypothetical protein [Lachnospiraceae bacterium]
MSEFILKEEPFSLGILSRVPTPVNGECFLLYKTGGGEKESIVINLGDRYSSAEVRHGHYNKKVTFSLDTKYIHYNQRVVAQEDDFYFDVTIKISYLLQDVKEYFFSERIEDDDIRSFIRDVIKMYEGKWSIRQSVKAQNDLQEEIERKFRKYRSIRFRLQEVRVVPDEGAAKMLQSNRDKAVEIHVAKNETDEKIAKNEQSQRVLDSEYELKTKKIKDMALMMKNFGSLGPIVQEYLQGDMNGEQLYEYIMKAKANDISMLNTAASGDLLTQEEIMEKIVEIMGDTRYFQMGDEKQISNKVEKMIEEKQEEIKQEETEEISLGDGDYL